MCTIKRVDDCLEPLVRELDAVADADGHDNNILREIGDAEVSPRGSLSHMYMYSPLFTEEPSRALICAFVVFSRGGVCVV